MLTVAIGFLLASPIFLILILFLIGVQSSFFGPVKSGIALGSLLCERLSGPAIEIGLVAFGAFGLSAFAIDLYFATVPVQNAELVGAAEFLSRDGSLRLCFDLAGIAMCGGFYIVPL